jgi:hypothetical protein
MARSSEARRRLEQVVDNSAGRSRPESLGLLASLLHRIPVSVRAVVTGVAALYVANLLGLRIPGRSYLRSVFGDPWVFLAVRAFVILLLFAASAVTLWFALSAISHIRNRRWIRRLAGLEPQALYRGATEVEEALDEIYQVRDETRDRNAELIAALERTNQRVLDLEEEAAELKQENAVLRAQLAGDERQLSFGAGS